MIGLVQKALQKKHTAKPVHASLFIRDGETMGLSEVPFDLFIDESHKLEYQISDHPVQDGSVISDHIQRKLRSVTIKGMFTNHPLKKNIGNTDKITVSDDESENAVMGNIARDNYNKLEALAEKKGTVRLVCSLLIYPKLAITSISADRGPQDGESIKFTMTLRELNTVTLKEIKSSYVYSPPDVATDDRKTIASQKKTGRRSAEEKTADELKALISSEALK